MTKSLKRRGNSQPLSPRLKPRDLIASLTKREHEVMRLARNGVRNKGIADTLNLGVRTIEPYRHQAFQTLGESKLINNAKILQSA